MSKTIQIPESKYGIHCMIIELAMALDDAHIDGQDWDLREDNLQTFVEAEEILNKDWTAYDKDTPPKGYENLPYKGAAMSNKKGSE